MSDYSATLTVTVPISQRETGKRISRALDQDVGGYEAFGQFLDAAMQPCLEADAIYTTYSSPCSQELAGSLDYLIANPAALQAMVAADYAARWTEFEAPTLAECEAFCAGVVPQPSLDHNAP